MRDERMMPHPLPDIRFPPGIVLQIRDDFVDELARAAGGEKTSLAFVRNPLSRQNLIRPDGRFQVMVIGGSNFEQAIIADGNVVNEQREAQPAFQTVDDLTTFVAERLDPHVNVVGLNFAYPLEPVDRNGVLDGVLFRSVKGQLGGVVGQPPIGKLIEDYVRDRLGREVRVTAANDTICLLLSGLDRDKREQLGAGVVGTGYNAAFFADSDTAINIEAGNFNRFPQTPIGEEIDEQSDNRGVNTFEKELAGAYLFKHFNRIMQQTGLPHTPISSTEELSQLASIDHADRPDVYVARNFIERSASLVATHLAGIYEYVGQPERFTFVVEGSLFWQGWQYPQLTANYLIALGLPTRAIRFVEVKNSALLGAAALVI